MNLFEILIRKFTKRSPDFQIFIDGSHKGKWGSWAFVVLQKNKIIHEDYGKAANTNSQRMEYQAAIEALKWLPSNSRAQIFSDYRILINALKNPKMQPKSNHDQYEILKGLSEQHQMSWNWIRAHSGNPYNDRCDELCVLARS